MFAWKITQFSKTVPNNEGFFFRSYPVFFKWLFLSLSHKRMGPQDSLKKFDILVQFQAIVNDANCSLTLTKYGIILPWIEEKSFERKF